MDHDVPAARSSFPDSVATLPEKAKRPFFSRRKDGHGRKVWKPLALRPSVLVITILACWSLIAILQLFLSRSQQNGGVIFAPKINDLPLSQTFVFRYLPTIVAVVFSIYWAWIDLETKRMEPYYQLSKEGGALGKDSLLLQYPFDFLPFVPLKACRDRHWPVFWASLAILLVTWGLVPTQAGIFSVKSISQSRQIRFERSTAFVPASKQEATIPYKYAQSVYAIAALNETLTSYMARNYTLAPFRPSPEAISGLPSHGNWTVETMLYSLDMYCEPAIQYTKPLYGGSIFANSSNGCSFSMGLNGNITDKSGNPDPLSSKEFTGMYVGYSNPQGFADYSLDRNCPPEANHTFYAAMQRNKARDEDPPNKVTSIFCWPMYYQQRVNATVDVINREPLEVHVLSEKQPIPNDVFNTTLLESQINGGSTAKEVRSDTLPSTTTPKYLEAMAEANLSLGTGPSGLGLAQPMVGLAIALGHQPLENYLDHRILSKAYADAYRLMFARAMREVLDFGAYDSHEMVVGQTRDFTEAVVLEPVFVYIVEGLLGVVTLAAIALLYLMVTRSKNLHFDPSTIAAVMALVADNQPLLSDFQGLDCCSAEAMDHGLGQRRFKLCNDGSTSGIVEIDSSSTARNLEKHPMVSEQEVDDVREVAKPIRPLEFRLGVGVPVISLFIALIIGLTVLFIKARTQGLSLPSSNSIIQNLIQNYFPTAIATMIEPFWVLINRLLCLLQPIEELQDCKAKAKESIDLNYSSLPPQLVIFKALRAKHFILTTICVMALLTNVLAVAFAGLFHQDTVDMRHATILTPPLDFKFVNINGSIGPIPGDTFGSRQVSGAYHGGDGRDQFYVAESNITDRTPLPAWTDKKMFYVPFFAEGTVVEPDNTHFEADTNAFGADLECTSLNLGESNFEIILAPPERVGSSLIATKLTISRGSRQIKCSNLARLDIRPGPVGGACVRGPSAAEVIFLLHSNNVNGTVEDDMACRESIVLGWLRTPDGWCKEQPQSLSQGNSTFLHCTPKLKTGYATVRVDTKGRLQKPASNLTVEVDTNTDARDEKLRKLFSNDPVHLVAQSNMYIFRDNFPGWHNDSFASDYTNYFIKHGAYNSTRLVDPNQSPPTFDEIYQPLRETYSSLFAIWMGLSKHKLLIPYNKESQPTTDAWKVQPERRLFLSTPMFIVAEAILCIYAIIAMVVYLKRPGQYLARMPTSIASVIALFAASTVVEDMRNTSHLNRKERAKFLEDLDQRYGYGSFVGGEDGRVHIGIEKTPFVRPRSMTGWLENRATFFRRKGSAA